MSVYPFLSIGFVRIFYVVDCIAKPNFYRMNFGDSHSRFLICKKQVKIATQGFAYIGAVATLARSFSDTVSGK